MKSYQDTPRYSQLNYKIKIEPINALKEPCVEYQKILISRIKSQAFTDTNNSSNEILTKNTSLYVKKLDNFVIQPKNEEPIKKTKDIEKNRSLDSEEKNLIINKKSNKNESSSPDEKNAYYYSLFPNVPPVIRIIRNNLKISLAGRKSLYFRSNILTPLVLKRIFKLNGIRENYYVHPNESIDEVESSFWTIYYGKTIKKQNYNTLREYQLVNHFPNSESLGRKDYLWKNLRKMKLSYPEFYEDIMPETFLIQKEITKFRHYWLKTSLDLWIYKPSASARGIGIKLVDSIDQIPKKSGIMQKYIKDPFLINDSKFDLRIYATIITIKPLSIYIHKEGLVRFASKQYDESENSYSNNFVHLTNYSINKNNPEYLVSNDDNKFAHKWSLEMLWKWFNSNGINSKKILEAIKVIVVRTILSSYEEIYRATMETCINPRIPSELYGFDLLIDRSLKVWLLEVNLSPSMNISSKLDHRIKENVMCDYLNLMGIRVTSLEKLTEMTRRQLDINEDEIENELNLNDEMKGIQTENEFIKATYYSNKLFEEYSQFRDYQVSRKQRLSNLFNGIFDILTPGDIRTLTRFIDQIERRGDFEILFPISDDVLMDQYFYIGHRSRFTYEIILCSAYMLSDNKTLIRERLATFCKRNVHKIHDEKAAPRECQWRENNKASILKK